MGESDPYETRCRKIPPKDLIRKAVYRDIRRGLEVQFVLLIPVGTLALFLASPLVYVKSKRLSMKEKLVVKTLELPCADLHCLVSCCLI